MVTRSYRAARPDRLANGFGLIGSVTTRDEMRREIRGLINHSRHASHNFDYQRAYEMLFRRHVIGPNGIRLQMDVRKRDGSKDVPANQKIERGFARWGKLGTATRCGRVSWHGAQCQIATGIAREGGAFVRFYEGRGAGKFGFQIEPILFDRLDLDLTMPLAGGAYIEAGIEFDASDRITAYHIWNRPDSEAHRGTAQRRERVPASKMIYVLVPEEIGQVLGVPRSATALRLMNMSEGYQESAMTAANYGAAQMMFFEQQQSGAQIGGAVDDVPFDEIEAGTTAMLPPGVKPVPHVPTYPEAAIEPFMRHMGTSQAAGMGVAYETLTADLSKANFSSLRAGKGEERDEWRMIQRAVFEGLHDLIVQRWLRMAILSGQVMLPMLQLPRFLDGVTWRPRGWPSVNPKDDATANAADLTSGARSLTEIVAERGRSLDDVLDERAAEIKAFKDRELPVPKWALDATPTPPPEPPKEDDPPGPEDAPGDDPEGSEQEAT
ncbi:phage portal protein [Tropicibacter sp. R15_0]|uniref:phage portal protein n=1 Tax=Tropicibacter sp. R15_0 TaxID=2821101 RepID=UPI001ADA279C|nr:phage portal protein [Tropicibacter sp. R15_0]MBO9467056.1 phage portal protein [Tropicibacter sp. R15_0]